MTAARNTWAGGRGGGLTFQARDENNKCAPLVKKGKTRNAALPAAPSAGLPEYLRSASARGQYPHCMGIKRRRPLHPSPACAKTAFTRARTHTKQKKHKQEQGVGSCARSYSLCSSSVLCCDHNFLLSVAVVAVVVVRPLRGASA